MSRENDPVKALETRVDELSKYVLQMEVRLEGLLMQVEELSRFTASIRESLSIMGVTEGYAPPGDKKSGFDPSVG